MRSLARYSRGLAAFLGVPFHSLIANADTAIWAIAAADTWEWFPFTMLIALAALQMVPKEPQEAARIDGASELTILTQVVVPITRPVILTAMLVTFNGPWNEFLWPFLITKRLELEPLAVALDEIFQLRTHALAR